MSDSNDNATKGSGKNTLELYAKDLAIREKELATRSKEVDNNLKYALASLEAQERDRKNQREHEDENLRRNNVSGRIFMLLFAGIVVATLHYGHANWLTEIFRLFIVAVGGYWWGFGKGRRRP